MPAYATVNGGNAVGDFSAWNAGSDPSSTPTCPGQTFINCRADSCATAFEVVKGEPLADQFIGCAANNCGTALYASGTGASYVLANPIRLTGTGNYIDVYHIGVLPRVFNGLYSSVTNTASQSSLFASTSAGWGTTYLPVIFANQPIHIHAEGTYATDSGTAACTLSVYFGGNPITSATFTPTGTHNSIWSLDCTIFNQTPSQNWYEYNLRADMDGVINGSGFARTGTLTLGAYPQIDVRAQWSAASSGNTINMGIGTVDVEKSPTVGY